MDKEASVYLLSEQNQAHDVAKQSVCSPAKYFIHNSNPNLTAYKNNDHRSRSVIIVLFCLQAAGSPQTGHTTRNYTLYRQLEYQAPNTTDSNHLYSTLELLMMGIMVPETC
jgi:hypothetical protein